MYKQEKDYNIIDWWKKVFIRNYANFQGRARRSEFWFYILANIIIVFGLIFLSALGDNEEYGEETILNSVISIVVPVLYLASIIPSLAVTVRRLHDTNKSGWYYFISLIPLIGSIILIVWLATDGDYFTNNYGDDPKNPGTPQFDFENEPSS